MLISCKRNQLISVEKYGGGSETFDGVGCSRNLAAALHVFPRPAADFGGAGNYHAVHGK